MFRKRSVTVTVSTELLHMLTLWLHFKCANLPSALLIHMATWRYTNLSSRPSSSSSSSVQIATLQTVSVVLWKDCKHFCCRLRNIK